MIQSEKKKRLIASIARSMQAEGADFKVVKTILEKKLGQKSQG